MVDREGTGYAKLAALLGGDDFTLLRPPGVLIAELAGHLRRHIATMYRACACAACAHSARA